MGSRNVDIYRAGHEAFNRRDLGAMVNAYAESISWTDHARGVTFRTPQEFKTDFLEGWIHASSDCQVTDARYTDAGETVVARFMARGTNDGPVGPFPASGKKWTLAMCEMWHFDTAGRVVGGEIYYDQASLLTQLGRLPDPVRLQGRRAYDARVKQITCVCGKVVKGDDDDELWEKAQEHLEQDHPALVGKVSRTDILAQAEER